MEDFYRNVSNSSFMSARAANISTIFNMIRYGS